MLEGTETMRTFAQVIVEARMVARSNSERRRAKSSTGRRPQGSAACLNDLEHDRRYPPKNAVIEQIAKILNLSSDVLYGRFYAK
jgi:hypothetical protein